jgi:hypothetical protein
MGPPKNLQKARSEDFVLNCATTAGFMGFLEIWELVESVTCALSIRPIVGAPGLKPPQRQVFVAGVV